jgi:uncharacterized membrane protein YqgA involved in biofilm formation
MTAFNPLSGTLVNIATILAGSGLGLLLRNHWSKAMLQIVTQGVALIVILVGLQMAQSLMRLQGIAIDGVVLGLVSLVAGGLLGEWLAIETRLQDLGNWLKAKVRGDGQFTEGFVAASLLFCVGPMALVGCLNNGLTGDDRILVLKATMDGLAAIALAGSSGLGVAFSVLPLGMYQGSLALAAGFLAQLVPDPATNPHVLALTGVGGLAIVAIGLNLLEVTRIRVASFLPALVMAPLIYAIARVISPS